MHHTFSLSLASRATVEPWNRKNGSKNAHMSEAKLKMLRKQVKKWMNCILLNLRNVLKKGDTVGRMSRTAELLQSCEEDPSWEKKDGLNPQMFYCPPNSWSFSHLSSSFSVYHAGSLVCLADFSSFCANLAIWIWNSLFCVTVWTFEIHIWKGCHTI